MPDEKKRATETALRIRQKIQEEMKLRRAIMKEYKRSEEYKTAIRQEKLKLLDEVQKHIGDLHMERVGVYEMDERTSGIEAERQRFSQAISKIRKEVEDEA